MADHSTNVFARVVTPPTSPGGAHARSPHSDRKYATPLDRSALFAYSEKGGIDSDPGDGESDARRLDFAGDQAREYVQVSRREYERGVDNGVGGGGGGGGALLAFTIGERIGSTQSSLLDVSRGVEESRKEIDEVRKELRQVSVQAAGASSAQKRLETVAEQTSAVRGELAELRAHGQAARDAMRALQAAQQRTQHSAEQARVELQAVRLRAEQRDAEVERVQSVAREASEAAQRAAAQSGEVRVLAQALAQRADASDAAHREVARRLEERVEAALACARAAQMDVMTASAQPGLFGSLGALALQLAMPLLSVDTVRTAASTLGQSVRSHASLRGAQHSCVLVLLLHGALRVARTRGGRAARIISVTERLVPSPVRTALFMGTVAADMVAIAHIVRRVRALVAEGDNEESSASTSSSSKGRAVLLALTVCAGGAVLLRVARSSRQRRHRAL